jgi:anti-anti-sigma factor
MKKYVLKAFMSLDLTSSILYIMKRPEDVVDYDAFIVRVMACKNLDGHTAGNVSIFMKTLVQGGAKKIIIDMKGLEYIDSTGISMLINIAKLLRSSKGDIAFLDVPEDIQKLFQPIKLNRFINMFNTEDEAINFFKMI